MFGEHRPGVTSIWDEFEKDRDVRGFGKTFPEPDQQPLGMKIMQQGLGSLRGAVGTPDQIADMVERYEQAGVDQVIFCAQCGPNRHEHIMEAIELIGTQVIPRFAGRRATLAQAKAERLGDAPARAVARRPPAPAADPGYVVKPQSEPRPANLMKAARAAANGNGGAAGRLRKAGEAAFASFVRGRSDRQIDRIFGSEPALRILFAGMERAFVPEAAGGFDGAIQYVLESPVRGGTRGWAIVVHGDHAHAAPGRVDDARVTLRTTVPVFMRIAAGELNPAKAILDEDLLIEGDFQVAAKLGEMFGGESPW